jgi:peptidoglycan hydrolase-like protein with peptidoglycan-binding domain
VTPNRDDDRFANESPEFEFDEGGRGDPMSETVELARGSVASRPPARRGPTGRLALLIAGGVALGVVVFVIVSSVRGDGEGAPAAASGPQTAQAATSAADTGQTATSAPETTAAAPVEGALVPVAPDDEGDDVRALQEALAAAGFSAGEADGVYGDATVAAVAAFQRSVGLAEDGVAGAETIAALTEALGSG